MLVFDEPISIFMPVISNLNIYPLKLIKNSIIIIKIECINIIDYKIYKDNKLTIQHKIILN